MVAQKRRRRRRDARERSSFGPCRKHQSSLWYSGRSSSPDKDVAVAVEALRALADAANDALDTGAARLATDYAAGMAAAGAKHLASLDPERLRQQPAALPDLAALILQLTKHPVAGGRSRPRGKA